ncbi:prephenate dehydrogenase [Paenibacillus sp. J31TS4]|nr:prephenate dehydrogenase [Paenibacillus sp. J31TS4]
MGGSLALCFKGKPGLTVVGHSSDPAEVIKYLERRVVDEATTDFEAAAEGADFIFLCVPVGVLGDYLTRLSALPLKPGCIISDVGSTKASIVATAARLPLGSACFIGGHPMTGSERSGVEAASAILYENAFYILTPLPGTPEHSYSRLVGLLQETKAQVVRMDAEQHDSIIGAISHLPHVIAVALVNQIAGYNEEDSFYQRLAAGGFRDFTRIAYSDPVVWRDILVNNRDVVLKLIADWNRELTDMARLLETADGEGIERKFESARTFRAKLPERRKGFQAIMHDVYVDVPDHPGVIGSITGLLGSHGVNLSNIEIMESRADVPGVLRLSFREASHYERAKELLAEEYAVHA